MRSGPIPYSPCVMKWALNHPFAECVELVEAVKRSDVSRALAGPAQERAQVETIDGAIRGHVAAGELHRRPKDVHRRAERCDRAASDRARPTENRRNAHPAFPRRTFALVQKPGGAAMRSKEKPRTDIAREDHERASIEI